MLAHVCPNSKIGDAAARSAPSPGLPNAAPSNPLTREANRRRRKLHACNSTKSAWTLGRTAVRSCAAPSDLEFPGTSYIVFTRWNARKCRKRQGIKPPKCGRSSAGRAPPCQGGCREFESRRPLCCFIRFTQLHSGSFRLRAIGAAVARFPDTEEVTGSIPVSPTIKAAPLELLFSCPLPCLGTESFSSGRTPLAPPGPPVRIENARSDLAPRQKGGARGFN